MPYVVPYSKTKGSEKFKEFLAKLFTIDMLYPVFNDQSCETLFEDWRGKDMLNGCFKFTNNNKIILEFYPTYYTVRKNVKDGVTYMLALPTTIDNFINDMNRFGIALQWTNWICENFEPKEYLCVEEIKDYWIDLLAKMGKSQELL